MVFDGAAYYNLPTSTHAGTSSAGYSAAAAAPTANSAGHVNYAHPGGPAPASQRRSVVSRPYSYPQAPQAPQYGGYNANLPAHPHHHQPSQAIGAPSQWQNASFQSQGPLAPVRSQPPPLNSQNPHLPRAPTANGPPVTGLRHALPPRPAGLPDKPGSAITQQSSQPPAHQPAHRVTAHTNQPEAPLEAVPPPKPANNWSRNAERPPQAGPPSQSSSTRPHCKLCNLSFQSMVQLIGHQRNEHVKCCKYDEGCSFEGLPNVVELHEQDRHLVFRPGARREKTKPDGPLDARIQGTNISLDTEDDIAKWIEERRRKWPGSKNAELRAQRDLKRKEYDEASPAMSFQRGSAKRGRGGRGKAVAPARENGRRQEGRHLPKVATSADPMPEDAKEISSEDDEAIAAMLVKPSQPSPGRADARPNPVKSQDGNAYAASTSASHIDEEEDIDGVPIEGSDNDDDNDDGDSAPEEIATTTQRVEEEDVPENYDSEDEGHAQGSRQSLARNMQPRDCIAWTSTGICKFGDRCRFTHNPARKGRKRIEQPKPPKNPFERGDLVGKLVHHQVKHEISDLTQVIDFLARNNWLEQVELYPGHKQEMENRIREV